MTRNHRETMRVMELLRIAVKDYGLPGVRGGCDKDHIASRRAVEKGGGEDGRVAADGREAK